MSSSAVASLNGFLGAVDAIAVADAKDAKKLRRVPIPFDRHGLEERRLTRTTDIFGRPTSDPDQVPRRGLRTAGVSARPQSTRRRRYTGSSVHEYTSAIEAHDARDPVINTIEIPVAAIDAVENLVSTIAGAAAALEYKRDAVLQGGVVPTFTDVHGASIPISGVFEQSINAALLHSLETAFCTLETVGFVPLRAGWVAGRPCCVVLPIESCTYELIQRASGMQFIHATLRGKGGASAGTGGAYGCGATIHDKADRYDDPHDEVASLADLPIRVWVTRMPNARTGALRTPLSACRRSAFIVAQRELAVMSTDARNARAEVVLETAPSSFGLEAGPADQLDLGDAQDAALRRAANTTAIRHIITKGCHKLRSEAQQAANLATTATVASVDHGGDHARRTGRGVLIDLGMHEDPRTGAPWQNTIRDGTVEAGWTDLSEGVNAHPIPCPRPFTVTQENAALRSDVFAALGVPEAFFPSSSTGARTGASTLMWAAFTKVVRHSCTIMGNLAEYLYSLIWAQRDSTALALQSALRTLEASAHDRSSTTIDAHMRRLYDKFTHACSESGETADAARSASALRSLQTEAASEATSMETEATMEDATIKAGGSGGKKGKLPPAKPPVKADEVKPGASHFSSALAARAATSVSDTDATDALWLLTLTLLSEMDILAKQGTLPRVQFRVEALLSPDEYWTIASHDGFTAEASRVYLASVYGLPLSAVKPPVFPDLIKAGDTHRRELIDMRTAKREDVEEGDGGDGGKSESRGTSEGGKDVPLKRGVKRAREISSGDPGKKVAIAASGVTAGSTDTEDEEEREDDVSAAKRKASTTSKRRRIATRATSTSHDRDSRVAARQDAPIAARVSAMRRKAHGGSSAR